MGAPFTPHTFWARCQEGFQERKHQDRSSVSTLKVRAEQLVMVTTTQSAKEWNEVVLLATAAEEKYIASIYAIYMHL